MLNSSEPQKRMRSGSDVFVDAYRREYARRRIDGENNPIKTRGRVEILIVETTLFGTSTRS